MFESLFIYFEKLMNDENVDNTLLVAFALSNVFNYAQCL